MTTAAAARKHQFAPAQQLRNESAQVTTENISVFLVGKWVGQVLVESYWAGSLAGLAVPVTGLTERVVL